MDPEESLREYKTIFVSTNRPDEMESFRASRRGSVQPAMASGVACTGHRFRVFYMSSVLHFDSHGLCGRTHGSINGT